MQCFAQILFAQALLACALVLASVHVAAVRTALVAHQGWLAWAAVALFAASCAALRLLLLRDGPLAAGLCLYTLSLALLGAQLASDLISEPEEALGRGQTAVALGCGAILLAFLWVQAQARAPPTADVLLQSAGIVALLFGSSLIVVDDRVWEWKYAYVLLFATCIACYLNGLCSSYAAEPGKPLATCAQIILQPVLFAEDWILACLLA